VAPTGFTNQPILGDLLQEITEQRQATESHIRSIVASTTKDSNTVT